MHKFNTTKPRHNPRLIVTINADTSASVKGCYIDTRDNVSSYNRQFPSEAHALGTLHDMRDNGAEFAIQLNRKF